MSDGLVNLSIKIRCDHSWASIAYDIAVLCCRLCLTHTVPVPAGAGVAGAVGDSDKSGETDDECGHDEKETRGNRGRAVHFEYLYQYTGRRWYTI